LGALDLKRAAPLFAALGDATRLKLVGRLTEGPRSIARLTTGTRLTRQAVTKHLQALEQAGLVRSQSAGRERLWSLEPRRLAEAQRHLSTISAQWDAAIERLRDLVEPPP
jgi:DNA-binding transcriptional ArsR family regulator